MVNPHQILDQKYKAYLYYLVYYITLTLIYIANSWEDGSEIGGSGVHLPSTAVKHLADLRSRANSQQYSSIYEDRRPKIEDIERSDSKKSA